VPLRERNVLLLAAGYAPAYHETRFDDPKLDPVRTALARVLDGHLPYPAVVVDRHGELQLLTTLTQFGTAMDVTVAELRLEAFLPADQATASILTKLGRATPRRG
jgi:hypothetical protein